MRARARGLVVSREREASSLDIARPARARARARPPTHTNTRANAHTTTHAARTLRFQRSGSFEGMTWSYAMLMSVPSLSTVMSMSISTGILKKCGHWPSRHATSESSPHGW